MGASLPAGGSPGRPSRSATFGVSSSTCTRRPILDQNQNNQDTTPPPTSYSLTLKGDGIAVDKKIDEATALDVLSLVMGSGASTSPNAARSTATKRRTGQQSLREYLDAVEAKRNPDKILAVAKWTIGDTDKS